MIKSDIELKKKNSFSIVIPVYNESENIRILYNEIISSVSNSFLYEIIFINDGSNDNSLDIIKKLEDSKIKILDLKKNRGQSYAIYQGVINAKYNNIITIDADLQNDPKDINKIANYYFDNKIFFLVGGLRKKRKDSLSKIIASKIANRIRMFILKDGCLDTGCSLKIFDKSTFITFPYFNGIHRFLPALFTGFKKETKFIYINHRSRSYGTSKYNNLSRLFSGIVDIIKVLKIIRKNNV